MIRLEHVYVLAGLLLAAFASMAYARRAAATRVMNGLFWSLLALLFLAGSFIPPEIVGALILVLALIVALGGVRPPAASSQVPPVHEIGKAIFVPVLLMPLVTVLGVVVLGPVRVNGQPLVETAGTTLVCLTFACVIALAVGLWLTRRSLLVALAEGSRLLEAIGWAAVLPLLLATLGSVFEAAGVGGIVAELVKSAFPVHIRFVAVFTYAAGMAIFTMIMGNAFAAFPVMTAGVGLPILVNVHHADPASMCALGMLTGYCGTLMTPMAANFNLVPAALLELRDPYGVIKAQAPTGLVLFIVNVLLMNFLIFRT